MAQYGNFNLNRKKHSNKAVLAAVCVIVFLLAALFFVGIITSPKNEDMQRISSAIEENTQLKEEISSLNAEIVRLQEEVNDLNMQLEARPTLSPTLSPTTPPTVQSRRSYYDDEDEDDEIVSPRGSVR